MNGIMLRNEQVLEAKVHEQLRAFLRNQGNSDWPHHLTMARLVARALRLGRSSLIQVGSAALYQGHYRLSYLMSLLMWPEPAILVLPEAILQAVQRVDIPRIQDWMASHKAVLYGEAWPGEDFQGVLLTSPQAWLRDRIGKTHRFPSNVLTIIDGADDLEDWIRDGLTVTLDGSAWQELMQAFPRGQDLIRDVRVQLTHSVFQHPPNPYRCHLIDEAERRILLDLCRTLLAEPSAALAMPPTWRGFWPQVHRPESQLWARLHRSQGTWTLHCAPVDVGPSAAACWQQQPMVIIGGALDPKSEAIHYRQRLGLGDMTCLKFNPDRQAEEIQLYLPEQFPFPNTPEFQQALLEELAYLLVSTSSLTPHNRQGLAVVIVGDTPLKRQVATVLAAQFGSRVQLETNTVENGGILICGWRFWRENQTQLPLPTLLAIATLPIPSLEDPLVAGRVTYYKKARQDWFRLYLLPIALNELQRAIAPVRHGKGAVALLDTRVNHRSYGYQILDALNPAARVPRRQALWLRESAPLPPRRF